MRNINKEWVSTYFDYGVDVTNRKLFISDIDESTVNHLIKGLYLMDSTLGAGKTPTEKDKITLIVNSYGGSVYDALGLYDAMRSIRCPVETVAIGKCMSAATLIVAAGDERWATPNCSFMLHDMSDELNDSKVSVLRSDIRHANSLRRRFLTLLEKHTSLSMKQLEGKCGSGPDHYFDADTAIEYGLVNNLWDEK